MTPLQSLLRTLGVAVSAVFAVILLMWLCCAGFTDEDT